MTHTLAISFVHVFSIFYRFKHDLHTLNSEPKCKKITSLYESSAHSAGLRVGENDVLGMI